MTRTAPFIPGHYLVVPLVGPFFEHELAWRLAVGWNDAIDIARAREQDGLAYLGLQRTEHYKSVAAFAMVLGRAWNVDI